MTGVPQGDCRQRSSTTTYCCQRKDDNLFSTLFIVGLARRLMTLLHSTLSAALMYLEL